MESIDIQRFNAHWTHEPICSRRRESALISAVDGARWRGLTSAATEPRFMESIDIQRFNAHWTHEPICSRRRESALISAVDGARWRGLTSAATEPRFMESYMFLAERPNEHEPGAAGVLPSKVRFMARFASLFSDSLICADARWPGRPRGLDQSDPQTRPPAADSPLWGFHASLFGFLGAE